MVLRIIAVALMEELEEGPPVETGAIVVTAAKVGPRARAARQVMVMPEQAHHLQVVTVGLSPGVEELGVSVGRMEVVLVAPVMLATMQVEVAAAVPGILGAEVDHSDLLVGMVPAEGREGLPIRRVRARAPLPEVVHLPGIMAILTTRAVPVREVQEDLLMVMELMAMTDGS